MQSTKPSLNGQENGQQTMDASSSSSQSESSRFDGLIKNLKGSKISNSKLREEVFNILLDDATESPESGKYYTFEYDPKFADKLTEWDEYPLVYAMEFKKDNLIGANLHHMSKNTRLSAINNKQFPKETLRQYIPKRADSIFFEIQESDVGLLSTLPLEKFHYNR